MHKVIKREQLASNVTRLVVEAPRIAAARRPGQFVIVHRDVTSERIPLTIADADPQAGTITVIIQAVGKSTTELSQLRVGDTIRDIAGPLGRPTHIENFGTVACVGGGVGIAVLYPLIKALKQAGREASIQALEAFVEKYKNPIKRALLMPVRKALKSDELITVAQDTLNSLKLRCGRRTSEQTDGQTGGSDRA